MGKYGCRSEDVVDEIANVLFFFTLLVSQLVALVRV